MEKELKDYYSFLKFEKGLAKNTLDSYKHDLKIYVSTNKYTSERDINKLINDNYSNIVSMLEKALRKHERNEKSMILGKEVNIVVFSLQDKP